MKLIQLKKNIGISTVIFILMVLYCPAVLAEMVSIRGNDVNMRSGPGTKYEVLWELGQGFPLKVLQRKGEWIRVRDFEGSIGWVYRGTVTKDSYMIVKANKNSKKQINIRSGPGEKYQIVAKAYYGVVFKKIGQKNGWINVTHEKGVSGWVSRTLLWGW
jgi:SH3-like domain-containing protein